MRLALSPLCVTFLAPQGTARNAIPSGGQKRGQSPVANDAKVTSTKRTSLLRRDVVNDVAQCKPSSFAAFMLEDFMNNGARLERSAQGLDIDIDDSFNIADDTDLDAAPTYIWQNVEVPAIPSAPHYIPTLPLVMFTRDQKWTIALLKLLVDMNAPDYAFASTLRWARAAHAGEYSYHPEGGLSRMRNIDVLFVSLIMQRDCCLL